MEKVGDRPERQRNWWLLLAIGLVCLVGAGAEVHRHWRDSAALRAAALVNGDRPTDPAMCDAERPTDDCRWPAPHGLLSLQLATSPAHVAELRAAWGVSAAEADPRAVLARNLVKDDSWLMAAYVSGLVLLIVWGGAATRIARLWVALALVLPLVAAAADALENEGLLRLLAPDGFAAGDVALVRMLAQAKFVALLVASAVAVVLAGGGARLRRDLSPVDGVADGFEALMQAETAAILAARDAARAPREASDIAVVSAEEPRVWFRSSDIVGLSLSGGGIRSATFNLGLLQELAARGILPVVDYLSTVSGGGYVGGFLSAWLSSRPAGGVFPVPPSSADAPASPGGHPEAGEVRHLREFSEFLVPRRGLFEVEMWRAVVAVLAGLLPALLMALSMIGLALVGWLVLTFVYACDDRWASVLVVVSITAAVLALLERSWRAHEAPRPRSDGQADTAHEPAWLADVGTAVFALLVVGVLQWSMPAAVAWRFGHAWPVYEVVEGPPTPGATGPVHAFQDIAGLPPYERWWRLVGTRRAVERAQLPDEVTPPWTWFISPRLFEFAVAWWATGLLLLALRLGHAVNPRPWSPISLAAFDRVVMRLFGLGLVWILLAATWHLCANLGFAWQLLAPTLLSAGGFAATRHWMSTVVRPPAGASSVWARVQEFAPQGLAYLTLILTIGAVGSALIDWNQDDWLWWYRSAAVMSGVLAVGLLIDPAHVGLHAFYRERIGRAYLGARLETEAAHNRSAEARPHVAGSDRGDDVLLSRLPERPLHLVCCAANDLKGDPVETLTRGARSATLSRHGFSLANDFRPPGDLTLGAAVTASAAAFNSAMGAHSIRFGPVVGFLITALNLRLGLWVRHPRAAAVTSRRWPGLLLYREFFGLTAASDYRLDANGVSAPTALQRDVHLSDGGHFENLGLYELVRRHCRYIIVSDCGADPEVAFDDLGNALRRVREDFGIEIELDVAPLRPDAKGCSTQHAVVGSINYSDVDRGVLVYIKPTLTGDEPPDVRQYKTRNEAFPHEGTSDQFYDEAQWESYRRLGHHAAERVFGFMREVAVPSVITADWLFGRVQQEWYPTPPGLQAQVLAMTERFGQLERELRDDHDSRLLQEVFPEVAYLRGDDTTAPAAPKASLTGGDLAFMLRITQAMEDVWTACDLERQWAHPLNTGWVNLFARWTTAPTFRTLWPLLAPLYNRGFQRFLQQRLGVTIPTPSTEPGAALQVAALAAPPAGLATYWWTHRMPEQPRWRGHESAFRYFALQLAPPVPGPPLDLGITAVSEAGDAVGWSSDDFFVPPSLWGAGFGGSLLRGVLNTLAAEDNESGRARRCYVSVRKPKKGHDHRIAREDERNFVAQYRAHHFQQLLAERLSPVDVAALQRLNLHDASEATVLVLDLKKWRALRPS
jgi:hypothetical protein